jgi:DNA-binding transcriptional LysR family regulator
MRPELQLQIIEANDRKIENDVFREKLDIGCIGAKHDLTSFDFHLIKRSRTHLGVNKNHHLASKKSIWLRDIQKETLIVAGNNYNARVQLLESLRNEGFAPYIGYEISNIIWIGELLRLNRGVFLSPDIPPLLANEPEIVFLPVEDDPHTYNSYIITKKNYMLSKGAELFKQHLIEMTHAVQIIEDE